MAGTKITLDTVSGITITTANILNQPAGGHAGVTFLLDVNAITGIWDVLIEFRAGATNFITVASLLGVTTTGLKRIPLSADFNLSRSGIPAPNRVTYTNIAAGALSSAAFAVYGD